MLQAYVSAIRIRVRFADKPVLAERNTEQAKRYRDLAPHIEGPPGFVAERLLEFERGGLQHLVLNLHEGDPLPDLLNAMDVMGSHVIPQLV